MQTKSDPLRKLLAEARKQRSEAVELLSAINSGNGETAIAVSRERAIEIVNGCIQDYGTIIRRFGRY